MCHFSRVLYTSPPTQYRRAWGPPWGQGNFSAVTWSTALLGLGLSPARQLQLGDAPAFLTPQPAELNAHLALLADPSLQQVPGPAARAHTPAQQQNLGAALAIGAVCAPGGGWNLSDCYFAFNYGWPGSPQSSAIPAHSHPPPPRRRWRGTAGSASSTPSPSICPRRWRRPSGSSGRRFTARVRCEDGVPPCKPS